MLDVNQPRTGIPSGASDGAGVDPGRIEDRFKPKSGETIPAALNNHQAFGSSKLCMEEGMPIDKELLAILACPKCKGDIHVNEKGDGLTCAACKLMYPIKDDIPVMLIDEAIPLT